MLRFVPSFILVVACSGCAAQRAVQPKEEAPREIVFAGDTLRTVVPGPAWTATKDALVTEEGIPVEYDLLMRRSAGVEIAIKTYPTSAISVTALAERLRAGLAASPQSPPSDIERAGEDRASFSYVYADAASALVAKVAVIRLREDLGVVAVGTWPPGDRENAAAFEKVTAALAPAVP